VKTSNKSRTESNIFLATPKDANWLSEFCKETFISTYQNKIPLNTLEQFTTNHFAPDKLKTEILSGPIDFHLFSINGVVIGYAKTVHSDLAGEYHGKGLFIEKIYFKEEVQKKGYGRVFLEYLKQFSQLKNLSYLWLKVWEKNSEARAFYQKTGFKKIKEMPFQMENLRFNDHVLKLDF
jgi:ribosomal protein S18 acetylase RimI-like enzyme